MDPERGFLEPKPCTACNVRGLTCWKVKHDDISCYPCEQTSTTCVPCPDRETMIYHIQCSLGEASTRIYNMIVRLASLEWISRSFEWKLKQLDTSFEQVNIQGQRINDQQRQIDALEARVHLQGLQIQKLLNNSGMASGN